MKTVLMILVGLMALGLPSLARAECNGSPNAVYVLFPVGSSDDAPNFVPGDQIVITGKVPAIETTADVSWSGNDQHVCGQKWNDANSTWVNDTRFLPADHLFRERSIVRVQRNASADHTFAYFSSAATPPINGKYKLLEEINNTACRDQGWKYYWKNCLCKKDDCSS